MGQEIVFESMSMALEGVRGTAVTPPTRRFNISGVLTPMEDIYYPPDQVGELANYQRSEFVHRWSEFKADGGLDVTALPFLLQMAMAGGVSPTTPTGGNLTRLWSFVRALTSDNIKSATNYWGDPNIAVLQGAYAMLDQIVFTSDAGSKDGAKVSFGGRTQMFTELTGGAIPAIPAAVLGPILIPGRMQLWLDTGATAIGTTEITGRVLSAKVTVPSGVTYKYPATGPSGGISYSTTGRKKTNPTLDVSLDMVDRVQFANYRNGDNMKARLKLNGPLIEGTLYHYVQFDIYGKFSAFKWGEYAGSNRTMDCNILGEKNATLGSDLKIDVQTTTVTA